MNTLDIYIEKGRKEGFERGIEKGIEKGKEQIVQNLINTQKFTVSEIANLAGMPEAFVKKVRSSMNKKTDFRFYTLNKCNYLIHIKQRF